MRLLLVTNDFPPRVGGAQYYLWNIYSRLASHGIDVTVLTPKHPTDAAFDATAPMRIERFDGGMFWPTPRLRRRVTAMAAEADVVAFGVTIPMAAIGPGLDVPCVYHTNGIEIAWTKIPGARGHLRRIGRSAALVTGISDACSRPIADVAGIAVERLAVGVDLEMFTPEIDGAKIRARHGIAADAPLAVCISRLVRRKGQDTLIASWDEVRRAVPDAHLLIVGGGPRGSRLHKMAAGMDGITFAGEIAFDELPAHHAAADVFAMPCRTRLGGLEVEGLGLCYLEAQACGRPVIAGDSGGAPEALVPGETGEVVRGGDQRALARALTGLLGDRATSRAMGARGRAHVAAHHDWGAIVADYAERLRQISS